MNIFAGNLPLNITEEELREQFSLYGMVSSVSLMNDHYIGSGQPRCYCYVEMPSKNDGLVAISSLNGKLIRGRSITVIEALPMSGKSAGSHASPRRWSPRKIRQRGALDSKSK